MSRYIDAEFEIDHYTKITTHPTPDVSEKDKRDSLIILEALRRAKYIDIVRCGECKHWDDRRDDDWWSEDGACMKTTRLGYATYRKADDFCSYGERKESE